MHWEKEAKEYLYGEYGFIDFDKAKEDFNLKPSMNRFNNTYDLRYTGIDKIFLNAIKENTNINHGEAFFIHLIKHHAGQNMFEYRHENPKEDYYYFLHFLDSGIDGTVDFIDRGKYIDIEKNFSVLIPVQFLYDFLIKNNPENNNTLYYIKMLVKLINN
jgi:hypothetical protein